MRVSPLLLAVQLLYIVITLFHADGKARPPRHRCDSCVCQRGYLTPPKWLARFMGSASRNLNGLHFDKRGIHHD